jgi:aldehyde dehydrogenase (NAD+)
MLIHDDVYDEVSNRIVMIARGMRTGDPFDPQTVVGPLITMSAQSRVLDMIERAQSDGGGTLLLGGDSPGGSLANGFFVEPTVFGEVDATCELGQVEVFGPVLSLLRFSTEEEAIALANATDGSPRTSTPETLGGSTVSSSDSTPAVCT